LLEVEAWRMEGVDIRLRVGGRERRRRVEEEERREAILAGDVEERERREDVW